MGEVFNALDFQLSNLVIRRPNLYVLRITRDSVAHVTELGLPRLEVPILPTTQELDDLSGRAVSPGTGYQKIEEENIKHSRDKNIMTQYFLVTEHSFEGHNVSLAPVRQRPVNGSSDGLQRSTAIFAQASLNRYEVLPVVVDCLDRGAAGVVCPECAGGQFLDPCCQCSGVRPSNKYPGLVVQVALNNEGRKNRCHHDVIIRDNSSLGGWDEVAYRLGRITA